jgi:hypothetical protein
VLAADYRDRLTKALPIHVDEPTAVAVLLLGHALKHVGRLWVIRPQPVGIGGIDAPVLLLRGDGQGQDLLVGEVGEPLAVVKAWDHAGQPSLETF